MEKQEKKKSVDAPKKQIKKKYVDIYEKQKNAGVNNFKRLIAYFIDWYIATMFASIPIVFITSAILKTTEISTDVNKLPTQWKIIALIAALVIYFAYYFILQLKVYPGQTIGKRLMHIKVVKEDGSKITAKQVFLREIVGVMLIEGYISNSSSFFHQLITLTTGFSFTVLIMYVFQIISFISVIVGVLSAKKQMFHDRIAKTIEVKVEECYDHVF